MNEQTQSHFEYVVQSHRVQIKSLQTSRSDFQSCFFKEQSEFCFKSAIINLNVRDIRNSRDQGNSQIHHSQEEIYFQSNH